MNSKQIVTFGEIMLRLAPYNFERIIQTQTFQATYGGGEANVAVSLANFSNDVCFVSSIPNNSIGDAAVATLRKFNVNTEHISRSGDRLGIYFLEHGASIRPSKVVYDRAGSSIATADESLFDWAKIFKDKGWFHTTGITPALSKNTSVNTLNAVKAAKEAGLTVSCDLNYRKKLWTKDEAKATMTQVVQYVDIIIANEEDCADVFGIKAESTDVKSGTLDLDHYRSVAEQVMSMSSAKIIAITLRESLSASDNNWSAMLYDGKDFYVSKKYPIHIIDRVGGGDSFGAGLIHALIQDWNLQKSLEFAVAASALKQTIPGDMNLVCEDDVLLVVNGDISGRVQR